MRRRALAALLALLLLAPLTTMGSKDIRSAPPSSI